MNVNTNFDFKTALHSLGNEIWRKKNIYTRGKYVLTLFEVSINYTSERCVLFQKLSIAFLSLNLATRKHNIPYQSVDWFLIDQIQSAFNAIELYSAVWHNYTTLRDHVLCLPYLDQKSILHPWEIAFAVFKVKTF